MSHRPSEKASYQTNNKLSFPEQNVVDEQVADVVLFATDKGKQRNRVKGQSTNLDKPDPNRIVVKVYGQSSGFGKWFWSWWG